MNDELQPLTTMEKITFLRGSSFFASLPLEELYHVALSIEEESVKMGETVIREGTMGDKMYIVVSGELEVKKRVVRGWLSLVKSRFLAIWRFWMTNPALRPLRR